MQSTRAGAPAGTGSPARMKLTPAPPLHLREVSSLPPPRAARQPRQPGALAGSASDQGGGGLDERVLRRTDGGGCALRSTLASGPHSFRRRAAPSSETRTAVCRPCNPRRALSGTMLGCTFRLGRLGSGAILATTAACLEAWTPFNVFSGSTGLACGAQSGAGSLLRGRPRHLAVLAHGTRGGAGCVRYPRRRGGEGGARHSPGGGAAARGVGG